MSSKIETRCLSELRAAEGDEMALVGYAARFNSESKDLGGYKETIAPGAFSRALKEGGEVKCLFNHDSSQILGRTKNGTLTLSEDDKGLRFRCVLNKDDSAARDLHARVKSGLIDECSFAFTVPDGGDEWDATGTKRTLRDVNLLDVSAVTDPAYKETSVSARNHTYNTKAWLNLRKIVSEMPDDWKRSERAANIALQMVASGPTETVQSRGNQDWFADRCRECCDAAGLDFCSHTNEHIFASPKDSDSDEDCCRYLYSIDEDGSPILDEDSRTQVHHKISHTVRAIKRQRREDAEQRDRMLAANGICSR
jgi:uncharacterized protein